MTLLSWMRTIKQKGLNPSKELNGGFCCLKAQVFSDVQDIRTNSFSFSGSSHDLNLPKVKDELLSDEDGFCGFLAIGTLGTDPETPRFSALVAEQDVTEVKNEIANVITKKVHKFLEEQSDEDTLVERLNVKGDNESNVSSPLQGHDLVRSSTELTKKTNGGLKKKKSLLTSLFKKGNKGQEESYIEKHGSRNMIHKIFEKLQGASSKTKDGNEDSKPKKKDFKKSAQICRSKVHPVLYTPPRNNNNIDDKRKLDLKVIDPTKVFPSSSSISEANRTRENWIKTDSEYLVLEL